MSAEFWTPLTGVDTVQPFYDQAEAQNAAAAFVQSYDDSRTVTVENWRAEIAALNDEMDDAGEAGYLCTLSEHLIPNLRAVAILEEGEVCRIEAASPLLHHVKVAVVEAKFRPLDYHPQDVFQVLTPQGPIKAAGHIQGVQPQEWPIKTVFDRIAASEPVRAG